MAGGEKLTNGVHSSNNGVAVSEVVKIRLTIDEHKVVAGAEEVLKVIRPHWSAKDIKFKVFTDGITNKLVGCFHAPSTSNVTQNGDSDEDFKESDRDVVLVRVYGNKTDMLIDRKAETRNIKLLHQYGFAPRLYATFDNGLAYEYVPGTTLTPESVREPRIWPLVAKQMARMHRIDLAELGVATVEPMLKKKMEQFLNLVPEVNSDPKKAMRIAAAFPSVTELREEFSQLYDKLKVLGSPTVFCHNDLLLGNVIYTASKNHVTFIDYEYGACNFQGFDLGNHFAEYAGVDEIDYSRYPEEAYQKEWLRVYLLEFLSGSSTPVTDDAVHRLYVQVNKFALSAHFLWAVWAQVQAEHSTIDFDFIQFGKQHFDEYRARRETFLSLE